MHSSTFAYTHVKSLHFVINTGLLLVVHHPDVCKLFARFVLLRCVWQQILKVQATLICSAPIHDSSSTVAIGDAGERASSNLSNTNVVTT